MTEIEAESRSLHVMEDLEVYMYKAISEIKSLPAFGPVSPLIERLEEAGFWLRRCIMEQDKYIKSRKSDSEKCEIGDKRAFLPPMTK